LAVKIIPRANIQAILERNKDAEKAKKELEREENREMRTIREASIMLLLHHPYIANLEEMMLLEPYYYMLMEYVNGGQLLDYIIAHGRLKEKNARRFARQIVSALGMIWPDVPQPSHLRSNIMLIKLNFFSVTARLLSSKFHRASR
jgi:serine/threonine protein kinase